MSEFWQGVIVALVVSVVANLITPMTRTALLSIVIRAGNSIRALGNWGLSKALSNSEKELITLDEYHTEPKRFSAIAFDIVAWNIVIVWIFTTSLLIIHLGGWIPSDQVKHGLFGLLGASTSHFFRLFVLILVAERLRSYEKYRPTLIKRIESLKSSIEAHTKTKHS